LKRDRSFGLFFVFEIDLILKLEFRRSGFWPNRIKAHPSMFAFDRWLSQRQLKAADTSKIFIEYIHKRKSSVQKRYQLAANCRLFEGQKSANNS
jgi:hypothetical protein